MNRYRNKQRKFSILEITLLSMAAPVLMAGGFVHAWLKNSHVEVMREIDKTQQRISDHEDSINSLQIKIDRKLNIYQIRDELARSGSSLRQVPSSAVENIPRHRPGLDRETSPDRSVIAQIRP